MHPLQRRPRQSPPRLGRLPRGRLPLDGVADEVRHAVPHAQAHRARQKGRVHLHRVHLHRVHLHRVHLGGPRPGGLRGLRGINLGPSDPVRQVAHATGGGEQSPRLGSPRVSPPVGEARRGRSG
eukprot:1086694-Prorocentrum_minimum.AAC.1